MAKKNFKRAPQRGSIVVWAAIIMVVMLAMIAFGVDVGYMTLARTNLQTTADSSVLAGAQLLSENDTIVRTEAKKYAAYHSVGGTPVTLADSDILFGNWDTTTRTFSALPTGYRGNALKVTAHRENEGLFFAKVLGTSSFNSTASAVAMKNPRDIVFVVDLSGSMSDDTEPAWATDLINTLYNATYPGIGTSLIQNFYNDFGFGPFPGTIQHIGQPAGVPQDDYAYGDLTSDIGPLSTNANGWYRIYPTDDEYTRKQKAYRWMIDFQIAAIMPNATPAPNSAVNYDYWAQYLDYIQRAVDVAYYVQPPPPPDPPPPPPDPLPPSPPPDPGPPPPPPPDPGPPSPPPDPLPPSPPPDPLPPDPPPPPPPDPVPPPEPPDPGPGFGRVVPQQPYFLKDKKAVELARQYKLNRGRMPASASLAAQKSITTEPLALLSSSAAQALLTTQAIVAQPPMRGAPPYNRGYLPPGQNGMYIVGLNNPNVYTYSMADPYAPYAWQNKIGYLTYSQFMLDYGRNMEAVPGIYTPLSLLSGGLCPLHTEAVNGEAFSFPPREQPVHSARRALIRALQLIRDRNSAGSTSRDQVAIVAFDTAAGTSLIQNLTTDYATAMYRCTTLQSTFDNGRTTATENGLILARSHIAPASEGGQGRVGTNKVIVLLTDGAPNVWVSSPSEITSYKASNPSSNFYSGTREWYNGPLMQTAIAKSKKWDTYPVGVGLGTDYVFMDKMARMGGTADASGQCPRGSGNPAEYEQRMVDIFTKIIEGGRVRLVD